MNHQNSSVDVSTSIFDFSQVLLHECIKLLPGASILLSNTELVCGFFKACYRMWDFSNPIRSLPTTLCDMGLINLSLICVDCTMMTPIDL